MTFSELVHKTTLKLTVGRECVEAKGLAAIILVIFISLLSLFK